MLKFELSLHINRPVAEVFDYVNDPTHMTEWNSTIEEAIASETPLKVGTRIHNRIRMLGRSVEGTFVVVAYEPNKRVAWTSDEPFPLKGSYAFEAEDGGTRLVASGEAELGGFFKLSEPIVARIVRKQLQAQLDTAKELLEAQVPAGT